MTMDELESLRTGGTNPHLAERMKHVLSVLSLSHPVPPCIFPPRANTSMCRPKNFVGGLVWIASERARPEATIGRSTE